MTETTFANIQSGKHYRVLVTYVSGATFSFEGRVDDVLRTPSRWTLLHYPTGFDTQGPCVSVLDVDPRGAAAHIAEYKIFLMPNPLPTRRGAVIRHLVESGHDETRLAELVLLGGTWHDLDIGGRPRLVIDANWTLLYAGPEQ